MSIAIVIKWLLINKHMIWKTGDICTLQFPSVEMNYTSSELFNIQRKKLIVELWPYLFKYHHQEWLHQLINAKFSHRKASVQNTKRTSPWRLGGSIGNSAFRSRDKIFNVLDHAINRHKNVSNSEPTTPPRIFMRSVVTIWDSDSITKITVRNICRTEPRFVFTYFCSILLAYFLYIEHCTQPNTKINKKSNEDATVSRKQELIPLSTQTSVNSVPLSQYNIVT